MLTMAEAWWLGEHAAAHQLAVWALGLTVLGIVEAEPILVGSGVAGALIYLIYRLLTDDRRVTAAVGALEAVVAAQAQRIRELQAVVTEQQHTIARLLAGQEEEPS